MSFGFSIIPSKTENLKYYNFEIQFIRVNLFLKQKIIEMN